MNSITILSPLFSQAELPLITNRVPAGLPVPTEEYLGDTLDLNKYIIKNPTTTFFARVDGDSMQDIGILPDDILVVDRSLPAKNNDVVIAVVDGDMTVKRLSTRNGLRLVAANDKYADIRITGETQFTIWGVVTFRVGKV